MFRTLRARWKFYGYGGTRSPEVKPSRLNLPLRLLLFAFGFLLLNCHPSLLSAQQPANSADPQIAAALRNISAGQIQSDIEKLVSFQNRSTLSA